MKLILLFSCAIFTSSAFANDLATLLKSADRARGGLGQGMVWNVVIQSVDGDNETERDFRVKAKGRNAFVESRDGGRFKGESYIFNDGTIWFFKPSLKKPVSVSSRERLSGQAANGDIASTNYSQDYTPQLLRKEKSGNDDVSVLLLKAKRKQLTYDQIHYWINEKTKLAEKAEFLTVSGKVYKTAKFSYQNKVKFNEKMIPFISQMVITDAVNSKNVSTLTYTDPKSENVPASLFNVNNMAR